MQQTFIFEVLPNHDMVFGIEKLPEKLRRYAPKKENPNALFEHQSCSINQH